MAFIYETENFLVDSQERAFVSRKEGGHIRIKVKDRSITDRTKLSVSQAIELMRLSIIVGEAFEKAMNKQGIPVVKINYQDMGNWAFKEGSKPFLHIHIFGRAKNAKKQPFPESVYLPARETGFYDNFEPINAEDIKLIQKFIKSLFKTKKHSNSNWGLS